MGAGWACGYFGGLASLFLVAGLIVPVDGSSTTMLGTQPLFALDTVNAFGRFKVDATGKQIGKPAYAVQWLGGERHIVLPLEAATAKVAYPFKDWGKR